MKTTLLNTTKCWYLTVLTSLFITSQVNSLPESGKFSHVEFPKILMENTAWMPQISLIEPCTCLNNGSGQGIAQFSERVLISGESGENWVVVSATGLYHDGASVPPDPSDEVIAGDVILVDGMDPTSYFLDVVHIDGIGYQLVVTNGVDTLSIENRCYYPQPQINLSDNYCINHPPINMVVTAPPYSGVYSIEVNGMPTTTFNPAALGVGTLEVEYTYTAAYLNDSMPGCSMTLSREIEVTPNYIGGLACTNINISLGSGGYTKIVPDMLLMGNYGCASTFNVDILGKDSDTVWCSDIGKTYMVKVTDPIRNNTCWGNVYVEDKQGPTILCADTVIFCGTDFFNLPFSDFIQVSDNCDPDFSLVLLHQSPFNNPSCHPDYSASITRTYRATDKYGNSSVCTHTIYFDRPELEDIQAPADTTLQCDQAMDLSPENLGFPHVNGNEIGFFCEFSITYNDFSFTTCPGSRMIKRTFWVTDICTREMVSLTQVINIVDDEAPEIVCPNDITIFNTPGQCSGIYNFPPIVVSDNCVQVNQITVTRFVNGIPVAPGVNSVVVPVGENQITIWAQDPCFNIGVCNYTVNVLDVEGPSMACNPITVGLNAEGIIVVTIDSLDNFYFDNCGLSDTLIARMDEMIFGESVVFTCDDLGQNPIILVQVTDLSGNSNTCMVAVEVQDKLGPNVVYCPASFQVECNVEDPDLDDEPIFEDNCDPNPTVMPASSLVPGCCESYTIFRSWLATDNMGNTSICEQTIEVVDTTPPVVECVSEYTVFLDDSGEGSVVVDDIYIGATDICCEAPLVPDFTSQMFTCSDLFTTQFIVISVTDECDNTGSCEVAITVLDTITPLITVCPDMTINASEIETCDMNLIADYLMSEVLVAEDNCDTDPQMTFEGIENIMEMICDGTPGVFIGDMRFGVSDESGNSNTSACILTLTYNYDIAPEVTLCVEDVTLTLDDNGEVILDRHDVFEAEHVGFCAGIQINYNEESVLFTCDDIGPNMFEFIATQTCTILSESTVSCIVNITIEDDEAPVISCPTALTLALDENGEIVLDENVLGISATDNCSEVTYEFTPESFNCDDIGTETVVIIVSDESGNTAFCSISVTIVDETAPEFQNCVDVTLDLSEVGTCALIAYRNPALYNLTSNDACDGPISLDLGTVSGLVNFCNLSEPGQASGTVTFTASDQSGNESTCTINVTVINDVEPEIECTLVVQEVFLDSDGQGSIDIEDLATASFPLNCNALENSIELSANHDLLFDCSDIGIVDIIVTATLCDGLSAICIASVEVLDTISPLITCPDNITIECGEGPITVIGFVDEFAPGNWFEDIIGDGEIIVNAPTDIILISDDSGTPDAETNFCIEIPADGILRFNWTYSTNDIDGPAFDPFGYSLDGLFNQLTDNIGPNMQSGVEIILVSEGEQFCFSQRSDDGLFGAATTLTMQFMYSNSGLPEFSDNCFVDLRFEDDVDTGCGETAIIIRTWIAEDQSGNNNSCTQTIEVVDTTSPVIDCPIETVELFLDENGMATLDLVAEYPATDQCGEVIYDTEVFIFTCDDLGELDREFEVSDECGNISTCELNIEVIDNIAPEFQNCVPLVQFLLSDYNNCNPVFYVAPARVPTPLAEDNCTEIVNVTRSPSLLEALCDGDLGIARGMILFTAIDDSGNTSTCTTIVELFDDVEPILVCVPSVTVDLDENGIGSISSTDLLDMISDECDNSPQVVVEIFNFDCTDLGENIIVISGTDCAGNIGTCQTTVVVEDNIGPAITCVENVIVQLDSQGLGELDPEDMLDGLPLDNCSSVFEYEASQTDFDCDDVGIPIEVILTITDEEGNTSTCTSTIEVVDEINPVAICPTSFSENNDAGLCNAAVSFILADGTDNCAGVSQSADSLSGSVFPVGMTSVTVTATDASGNTDTCVFTITVIDNEPPVANCPPNITADTDPGECDAVVIFDLPTGSDNCPGVVQSADPMSGSVFLIGVTVVTVTATDASGNTDTCEFNITVNDSEDPVIDCPDDILVENDLGECGADVIFDLPVGSDNCGIYEVTADYDSGDFFPVGSTTVTVTAEDSNGNTSTCTFTITVEDTEAPSVTCPANVFAATELGLCTAEVMFNLPTPIDNCGIQSIVSIPTSGSTFNRGTTIVTVIATDLSGNESSCTFNVTVLDTEPPVAVCPTNIVAENDPGECNAIVNFLLPDGLDNCPGVMQIAIPESGSEFPVGMTLVTVTATDASGNTDTCVFTITVNDTEDPVVICPVDITVDNDPGECGADVNYVMPLGSDNCEIDTVTANFVSGTFFDVGITVVTITAEDIYGNTGTCTFTVLVNDTEDPVVICPDDILVDNDPGECGADVIFVMPLGSDNCEIDNVTTNFDSGAFFPVGSTVVTITAEDINGNTSTCSFTITVNDIEDPVANCPNDTIVVNDLGLCSAVVNFALPSGSDNCPGVIQIASPASGSLFPVGETIVTVTATDASSNTDTCVFTVTVDDTEDPVVICPIDIIVDNDLGECGAIVNYVMPLGSDNCEIDTVTANFESGDFFPVGSTVVTITAEDIYGNTGTCTFTIVVNDTEDPVVSCPDDIVVDNDPGECGADVLFVLPLGSDNCEIDTVTANFESGDFFSVGMTIVTITAEDINGNTSTCSFTITVNDIEDPVANCPNDTIVVNDLGLCSAVVNFALPSGSDNCPGVIQSADFASGSVFPVGETIVTVTATDASSNTDTCVFTVTVDDTENPVVDCPSDIIVDNDLGECGAIVNYVMPLGSDNCEIDTVTANFESGDFFPVGSTVVTITAEDIYGNTGTCTFTIVVNDTEDPLVICPDDIAVDNEPGECGADVLFVLPLGSDNCEIDTVTANFESGDFFSVGMTIVTITAEDINGNTSTCSFTITVNDIEDPVANCPNDTIVVNDLGLCNAVVNFALPSGSDNCPGVIQSADFASGSVFPVGETIVTVTATDASSNTDTCVFTVTVDDTEDPVVICPANINTVNDEDECGAIVNYTMPAGSDNCAIDTVTVNFESGDFFPVGPTVVTITAVDMSGNTGTCTFVINVFDTESPMVDCSGNRSVLCSANIEEEIAEFTFSATDNCGLENLVLDTLISYNIGACGVGNITLFFQATDGAGLSANCNRTLTISMDPSFELELGFIDFPEDVTLACGEDSSPANTGFPEEVRFLACAELEFEFEDIVSGMPDGCTTITRTWTVTDTCSMTMVNSDQIIVISDMQPIFSFVPTDLTVFAPADSCEAYVSIPPALGAACAEDITISNDYNLGGGDASGICSIGTTVVTFTITNACGNTATASVSVTVEDNTAPFVECPDDQTMSCLTDIEDFAEAQIYNATDACGIANTSINTLLISGDCGEEIYEVEFTATDTNGNVSACTYEVQAIPTYLEEVDIMWPLDLTISCDEDTTTVSTGVPTYPISCSDLEISYEDSDEVIMPDTCNQIDRTWTIRDLCIYDPLTGDGEYTYIQEIYLPNYDALFAMVEQGIEIEEETHQDSCSKYIEFEYILPAFCASDVVISNSRTAGGTDASDVYPVGETIVYFTIENNCEVIFEDSIIIRVFDNISPSVNCGIPFLTVTCADDIDMIIAEWPLIIEEACDYTISINSDYNLNDCGVGTIVCNYTVSDGSNNQAMCNVTLIVESDTQEFDLADIIWPATPIELTDCAADISPSVLGSFPESINPYYCLGLEFVFTDIELTPEGDECRRVQRTWFAYSNCTDDTLAIFIQMIIIDENNFSPIVISGFIYTENAEPIPFTDLYIPQVEMHATANMDGHYELKGMMPKEDLMLIPSNEVSSPYDGVTVADIKEINKYIHGKRRALSPYQIIAADIDRNGIIDDADAELLRELILGIRSNLPISQWRYVDNDYQFLDPKNPLIEDFPETKFVPMADNDVYRANFVGVKMGDVNNSYKSGIGLREREEAFIWSTPNRLLKSGTWNELPVYTNESSLLEAYQFTIHINLETGEYIDIKPSTKGELFWYEKEDEPGIVTICWFKGEDEVIDINEPVFTIRWFALQNEYLDNKIHISSDKTIAKQYMSDKRKGKPVFEIEPIGLSYAVHQNEPNPFRNQTFVPYQIPEDMEVMISVFDSYGNQVYSIKEQCKAGMGKMILDLSNLHQDGIYYYRMDAGTFSATKKMIKMN
jgi:hypothetical protein